MRCLRYWTLCDQDFSHCSLDDTENFVTLPEANLGLGWMDVYIHQGWWDFQHNHGNWVTAAGKECMVSLNHSISQAMILDPAPVYKKRNMTTVCAI